MSTDQQPFAYRAAEWIEHYWLEIAFGVSPLAITLASVATSDEVANMLVGPNYAKYVQALALFVVVLLLVVQGLLIYAYHKRKERVSTLRNELNDLKKKRELRALQVVPLIYAYLKDVGDNDLGFGEKRGESERLTLFLHVPGRSVFMPVSRYSNSPELSELPRSEYPDDEGCLASVWRQGWHVSDNYPHPDNWQSYSDRCMKDGLKAETLQKMRMRPRVLCGAVIWNKDRTKQVGALFLEATQDRYQRSFLEKYMQRHEHGYLGVLVDAME